MNVQPELLDRALSSQDANFIAIEIGVDPSELSHWRKGERLVPPHYVHPLAFALCIKPEDLYGYPKRFGSTKPASDSKTTRLKIDFGMDGLAMLPSDTRIKCSCGKTVNP